MCDVSRRELLGGAALLAIADPGGAKTASAGDINQTEKVSEGVYFHEGDLGVGHCNNGWILFEDYVLVIDANFPSGAENVIPKIRAITPKPIRFAFDTHHHGDHAYGNQVWVDHGAAIVGHTGVIEEMKKYETGYYGGKPGRWEANAAEREDVRRSKLKPPSVLFPKELIFDDGKRRVELVHLGIAHTHGDAFAWMPKEGILFSGDACVNGPYNYMGDGDSSKWIRTLQAAKKLGAKTICPGHGPRGNQTVLDDQIAYFEALRSRVNRMIKEGKDGAAARDEVERIRTDLKANPRIARYAGDFLPAQIEKVYEEMTGKKLALASRPAEVARARHALEHGRRIA